MSAAATVRNAVHPPLGTLAGETLPVRLFSSLLGEGPAVRGASQAQRGAGLGAGSLPLGRQGARACRQRGEIKYTSVCKSLQVCWAFRAMPHSATFVSPGADVTALFINPLDVNEKVTEYKGLAHRLRAWVGVDGPQPNGYAQSGADGGTATLPKRRQAPHVRGYGSPLPVTPAGVWRPVPFPQPRGWQYAARTGRAGFNVASARSSENCAEGASR
jgi:hypothetical protein